MTGSFGSGGKMRQVLTRECWVRLWGSPGYGGYLGRRWGRAFRSALCGLSWGGWHRGWTGRGGAGDGAPADLNEIAARHDGLADVGDRVDLGWLCAPGLAAGWDAGDRDLSREHSNRPNPNATCPDPPPIRSGGTALKSSGCVDGDQGVIRVFGRYLAAEDKTVLDGPCGVHRLGRRC